MSIRSLGLMLLLAFSGCGHPQGVTGGTEGVLHAGPERLAELQITIHQVNGTTTTPIGFGTTRMDGSFELVTTGAKGPLRLKAGNYACTLESVGSPLAIPQPLTRPESTTIKVTWTGDEQSLDLDIMELRSP
jgi:hypothetical protein